MTGIFPGANLPRKVLRARLPLRDGLSPTAFVVEGGEQPLSEHLRRRFGVEAHRFRAAVEEGRVLLPSGETVRGDPWCRPGMVFFLHRDYPPEPPVPWPLRTLHEDDRILVVDKPHFLSTVPNGSHRRETALTRLRLAGHAQASPAHRLDRLTAGAVLFVKDPRARGAYQTLFQGRRMLKEYQAIAPVPSPKLRFPHTVATRLERKSGSLVAHVVPGEINARTTLLSARPSPEDGWWIYDILPDTGKFHQIRAHMSHLGLPLRHDPLYPLVREPGPDDFGAPLGLIAARLSWTDPFSGDRVQVRSGFAVDPDLSPRP